MNVLVFQRLKTVAYVLSQHKRLRKKSDVYQSIGSVHLDLKVAVAYTAPTPVNLYSEVYAVLFYIWLFNLCFRKLLLDRPEKLKPLVISIVSLLCCIYLYYYLKLVYVFLFFLLFTCHVLQCFHLILVMTEVFFLWHRNGNM